ncbi:MAG: FHA domain-containing protein [Lentimicrobiaceae bacterium]|nr:FHA domain-containing protein [Lentimicrobiaceae bacterium]
MSSEFKQCPNGHYYQGDSCPYCKTRKQAGHATSLKTEAFVGTDDDQATIVDPYRRTSTGGGTKTTLIDDPEPVGVGTQKPIVGYSRTVFGDEEDETQNPNAQADPKKEPRYGRKLVGWLVTYSFDELGVDYKLYEGRNIIGRDADCNITVNDGRMSGKHAVLLFRANKYSLTDNQSSHGTFVNDEDIELEPQYLKDGDIIRMGTTVFKFRTSL